ncbi:MAG: hypothetical protein ACP5T0_11770 [Verrucomicrobiia bacterium]
MKSLAQLKRLAPAAITLLLTLFYGGCASNREYLPSVIQTQQGNAIIATLPAGTQIKLYRNSDLIIRAFLNETEVVTNESNGVVVLKTLVPLNISTVQYISERDERELEYIKMIELLKIQQNQKE